MSRQVAHAWLFLVAAWAATLSSQAQQTSSSVLFERARLITGDGSAPIEDSAFIVENDRFVRIGRRGAVEVPPGAMRVDLSGKTVMPTLIEMHAHLGYWRGWETSASYFTREQLLDDLQRLAYYGVGAVLSLGADRREIAYALRDEWRASPPPNAARYLTAGPGLALPKAGPAGVLSEAVYSVTNESEARMAVRALAKNKVDRWIKIWHDSRRGLLPPPVFKAIIDEAHRHQLRVAAHVHELEDFKDLLRAGIDGFAHPTWRQTSVEPVDDELVALFRQRPDVFIGTSFWTPRNQIYGSRPYWIDEPHPERNLLGGRDPSSRESAYTEGRGGGLDVRARAPQHEETQDSWRAVRPRYRHGRRRSGLFRVQLARRAGKPRQSRADSARGNRRWHEQLRGLSSASIRSARSLRPSRPTSSCWTPIHWTTSRTPAASRESTFAARRSIAWRCGRSGWPPSVKQS